MRHLHFWVVEMGLDKMALNLCSSFISAFKITVTYNSLSSNITAPQDAHKRLQVA